MIAGVLIVILAVIALIVVFGTSEITSDDVVRVGFIGPLTGDSAIIGEEDLRGVQLAVDELNAQGMQIELLVQDDQMDDKQTIAQYQQLTQVQGVDYVMTVTYGGFLALAERSEQDGVILLDSLDTSEELAGLSDSAFAIGLYDESIAYALADYLDEEGVEEVAVIMNIEDPFMLLLKDAFSERYDGEVQFEEFTFATKDFRTSLTKVSSYDHVVLLGWEETGLIVKQIHEMGLEPTILGIDTFASEGFRTYAGEYEGLIFSFWEGDSEKYVKMLEAYEKKYGKEPENVLFVAAGYDAMSVLGETLKQCEDVECTKDGLKSLQGFEGVSGTISMDEDQISRSWKETIYTYKDGEIVQL